MTRHVFFSFHYERDAWRASQVRNAWVTKDNDVRGYIDSAKWEEIRREGEQAIKNWISGELYYTSVTAVLIGNETASRPWVNYEIFESVKRGNGLFGIWINAIKDQNKMTDQGGTNPFEILRFRDGSPLSRVYPTYAWNRDNGFQNLGTWIENAARAAGR